MKPQSVILLEMFIKNYVDVLEKYSLHDLKKEFCEKFKLILLIPTTRVQPFP